MPLLIFLLIPPILLADSGRGQLVSREEFSTLFPEKDYACVLATFEDGRPDFKNSRKLAGKGNPKDCRKLARARCSELFELAALEKQNCPVTFAIYQLDPRNMSENKDGVVLSGGLVSTFTCESNGLMKVGNNESTYDRQFEVRARHYCQETEGHTCSISLMDEATKEGLHQDEENFQGRDGAEARCLNKARKLAREFCEKGQKVSAELTVKSGDVPLTSGNFPNLCHKHKLKKYFD